MMAEKPMVGCRVDADWKTQIDAIAVATGRGSADVVREALGEYLKRDRVPTLQNQVADLLVRVSALEDRHRALATLVANSN